MAILFTDLAAADYHDIMEFLQSDARSSSYADTVDAEIQRVLALVRLNPLMGVIPPSLRKVGVLLYRQILALDYRILYQPLGDDIYVHLLVHTDRNFQSILARRFQLKL